MSATAVSIEPWTGDESARYELVAGRVCLDFANTVTWTAEGPVRDRVPTFEHLVGWGVAAGLLDEAGARGLRAAADADPEAAARAMGDARWLRLALHRLFSAHAAGEAPAAAELEAL